MKRILKGSFFGGLLTFLLFNESTGQDTSLLQTSRYLKAFWDTVSLRKSEYQKAVFSMKGKEIIFFGTDHSLTDPTSQMYIDIKKAITNTRPTLILTENYKQIYNNEIEAIRQGTDVGFCICLANKGSIKFSSWDDLPGFYNKLSLTHSPDESLLFLITMLGYGYSQANYGPFEDFYLSLLTILEVGGFNILPSQKNFLYYKKIHHECYGLTFNDQTESSFFASYPDLNTNAFYRSMLSELNRMRDEHLLVLLARELKRNNKIFVQAGLLHYLSLSPMILTLLENAWMHDTISTSARKNDYRWRYLNGSTIQINRGNSKKPYVIIAEDDSANRDAFKGVFNGFYPSRILIQHPTILHHKESKDFLNLSIAGQSRYLANFENIPIEVWSASWNDVYYSLIDTYSNQDLFLAAVALEAPQGQDNDGPSESEVSLSSKVLYDKIIRSMILSGFPVTDVQTRFEYFENIVGQTIAPGQFIQNVQKIANKNIIDDIKRLQIANLLRRVDLEQRSSEKLLIQVDKEYLSIIKEQIQQIKN